MTWKPHERTKGEFVESFKYGKVYVIRRVVIQYEGVAGVLWSRVYLMKDGHTLRTMATVSKHAIEGLPPNFLLQAGDIVFISEDGTPSISRPGDLEKFWSGK